MSETKITHAVQQEIINLLHFSPNGTADAAAIAAYLHENMGYLRPKFCSVRWLEHTIYAMHDLLDARLVIFPAKPPEGEFCRWTINLAADIAPYLDALKAAENEQPDVADDREAIDDAWRAMRAEM